MTVEKTRKDNKASRFYCTNIEISAIMSITVFPPTNLQGRHARRDGTTTFPTTFPTTYRGDKSHRVNNNIIIIYSIYRALIPNGPKALYIIKKITTKS